MVGYAEYWTAGSSLFVICVAELNCVDRSTPLTSSGLDSYLEQQQRHQNSTIKLRSHSAGKFYHFYLTDFSVLWYILIRLSVF